MSDWTFAVVFSVVAAIQLGQDRGARSQPA
jgi:hypothetical protein